MRFYLALVSMFLLADLSLHTALSSEFRPLSWNQLYQDNLSLIPSELRVQRDSDELVDFEDQLISHLSESARASASFVNAILALDPLTSGGERWPLIQIVVDVPRSLYRDDSSVQADIVVLHASGYGSMHTEISGDSVMSYDPKGATKEIVCGNCRNLLSQPEHGLRMCAVNPDMLDQERCPDFEKKELGDADNRVLDVKTLDIPPYEEVSDPEAWFQLVSVFFPHIVDKKDVETLSLESEIGLELRMKETLQQIASYLDPRKFEELGITLGHGSKMKKVFGLGFKVARDRWNFDSENDD